MFGTIRKHQTWLWAVIITVTVISFVIYFNPGSKQNQSSRGRTVVDYGSVAGERVTEPEFMDTSREVRLRYYFMSGGTWPDEGGKANGFDPLRETYYRLFLMKKAEQLGIKVSDTSVGLFGQNLLRPFQRYKINTPGDFMAQILKPHGLTMADLERFTRHELLLQELISVVGMSGKLVTPLEVRALYQREREEMATEAVFFSATNYMVSAQPAPEMLSMFYSNQMANYRLPERIQVNYVRFNVTNYLAQSETELAKTNLNEIIEDTFAQIGTNYFKEAKTPEETKAKIREQLIRRQGLVYARSNALEFARAVYEMTPVKLENFETKAQALGLTVSLSTPFDREDGPKDLEVGSEFTIAAFSRTADEPFSSPIIGSDGVYVLAMNKRLPSEIPPLDQIKDRVLDDYKFSEAVALARAAGNTFYEKLTNGLAAGKTFEAACTESSLKPTDLPPFSLSTQKLPEIEDHISLNLLKQMAFSTLPGKVTPLQPTRDGAMVLLVKGKLPLDEAKMHADMPGFLNSVRQTRQNEAFNDWFRREAERGLRDTPLNRPNPQMSAGAAPKS
jgi:hypothetical protein